MNERIKEIIIEALDKEGLSDSRAFGHWALYDKHVKKFAELILTECIDLIVKNAPRVTCKEDMHLYACEMANAWGFYGLHEVEVIE